MRLCWNYFWKILTGVWNTKTGHERLRDGHERFVTQQQVKIWVTVEKNSLYGCFQFELRVASLKTRQANTKALSSVCFCVSLCNWVERWRVASGLYGKVITLSRGYEGASFFISCENDRVQLRWDGAKCYHLHCQQRREGYLVGG